MRIQHNIAALNAHRQLGGNNNAVSKSLEKLSSGYRINRAGDDAAGLAISEKMRAQIKGLETASKNAQDGVSLIQTAEGALTEVHSMLNRMVELTTQSSTGTYGTQERTKMNNEVEALKEEIDRISEGTNFNGINLLDGSLSGGAAKSSAAALLGSTVSTFSPAKTTGGATVKTDFASNALKAATDTFTVDGQTLNIDWTKGEAQKVFNAINKDLSSATAAELQDIADKLDTLFNDEMKAQGLTGGVSVTTTAAGIFSLESKNEGATSSVGWTGSSAAAADVDNTLGTKFFSATAGTGAVVEADKKFNSTITANDEFTMTINGTSVNVSGFAAARGDSMTTVASSLETQIQAAVTAYNTAMGTTGTTEELTAGDFTVGVNKNGGFEVTYGGSNKDVKFSFGEKTKNGVEGTAAKLLGLSGGTSSSPASGSGLVLQVGDTNDDFQKVTVNVESMSAFSLGLDSVSALKQDLAGDSLKAINAAIEKVSTARGDLGALQNRLDHTINNLGVTTENMTAAESRIRDVDMAKEMMDFTKNNILTQSAQAMLAQANQIPQGVLQLLQ